MTDVWDTFSNTTAFLCNHLQSCLGTMTSSLVVKMKKKMIALEPCNLKRKRWNNMQSGTGVDSTVRLIALSWYHQTPFVYPVIQTNALLNIWPLHFEICASTDRTMRPNYAPSPVPPPLPPFGVISSLRSLAKRAFSRPRWWAVALFFWVRAIC